MTQKGAVRLAMRLPPRSHLAKCGFDGSAEVAGGAPGVFAIRAAEVLGSAGGAPIRAAYEK